MRLRQRTINSGPRAVRMRRTQNRKIQWTDRAPYGHVDPDAVRLGDAPARVFHRV